MSKWTYYIETYGCKINQYESGAISSAWRKIGGVEQDRPHNAQYILVNSCAITARAERDARNAVYRLKRLAPNAKIILSGCAAQLFPQFRPRKNAIWEKPDLCIPQKDKRILLHGPCVAYGNEAQAEERQRAAVQEGADFRLDVFYRGRPVVKVQDGCSQNCTYCIVPQTRGKPASISPAQVLGQMRKLLEAGYAELIISGVNLVQYGKDQPEYGTFWDLLTFVDRELAPDYAGRARLRISSLEPAQLSPEGVEKLLALELVCPHLHLSLQHASPSILRKMGRGHYTADTVLKVVGEIGAYWHVMGLGADILVGFPGESEDDIKYLLDFIDALPLTYAHVFPFSARPGTPAMHYGEQLNRHVKAARAELIRKKVEGKKKLFWQNLLDYPAMLVAPDKVPLNSQERLWRGMNEFYVPCFFPLAKAGKHLDGLLRAMPTGIGENGLLVELM